MSIFALSTGKKAESSNGSAELGGSSDPMPDGTKAKAIITQAKWDEYEGVRFINLRWDIVAGEYAKRVVFQKVKVYDNEVRKADKYRMMLSAIDFNCGGKLATVEGEPTDIDLLKCLANKPMVIRLAYWERDGKSGNWVTSVESGKAAPAASQSKPAEKPAEKKQEPAKQPDFEDLKEAYIPF